MQRPDVTAQILDAKRRKGLSFTKIAEQIGADRVWLTAALLGQHPLSAEQAASVARRLERVRPVRVDCSDPGAAAAAPRSGCACANPVPRSVVADAGAVVPVRDVAGAVGACGDPQTLQYPSSYVPVHPSSVQETAVVIVGSLPAPGGAGRA